MKKTIEEVAEEYANNYFVMQDNHYNGLRQGFLAGAKWQAERMYTEEDMNEAFKSGRMVKNYKAEWEETYSDEMTSCKYEDFKQWFEQFKKK